MQGIRIESCEFFLTIIIERNNLNEVFLDGELAQRVDDFELILKRKLDFLDFLYERKKYISHVGKS